MSEEITTLVYQNVSPIPITLTQTTTTIESSRHHEGGGGGGGNVEERAKVLDHKINELEVENSHLKEKLDSTEGNVGGFIKDMNHILD